MPHPADVALYDDDIDGYDPEAEIDAAEADGQEDDSEEEYRDEEEGMVQGTQAEGQLQALILSPAGELPGEDMPELPTDEESVGEDAASDVDVNMMPVARLGLQPLQYPVPHGARTGEPQRQDEGYVDLQRLTDGQWRPTGRWGVYRDLPLLPFFPPMFARRLPLFFTARTSLLLPQ